MAITKLDLSGLKCPLPALKTRKALKTRTAWRLPRSALHRSAVGDRYPEPDPGNRRHGRDHRARRTPHRVPDRKSKSDRRCQCNQLCPSRRARSYLLPIDTCPRLLPQSICTPQRLRGVSCARRRDRRIGAATLSSPAGDAAGISRCIGVRVSSRCASRPGAFRRWCRAATVAAARCDRLRALGTTGS